MDSADIENKCIGSPDGNELLPLPQQQAQAEFHLAARRYCSAPSPATGDRYLELPLVEATSLRSKLERLHKAGELDGGLPIIRDDVLVGLIPAPDLEFALDNLVDEESSLCLMADVPSIDESDDGHPDPTDFTPFIDPVRQSR